MKHLRVRGGISIVGLLLVLGVACGGSDNASNSSSTTAASGGQRIGNCVIQPNTKCVGANLAAANLSGANLTAAVVTNATMVNTNLTGANLTQANFKGANIQNLSEGGAIQCETVRNDGTVNNSSCPPPATVTTTNTTTNTTVAPLNLPCQGQSSLFLTVYQSQADNFGLSSSVISSATTQGNPACASDGWATQRLQDSTGSRPAVFQATSGGWQLKSVTGCPGSNVPQQDQAGICE